MNLREGSRRLALLMGAFGCLGTIAGVVMVEADLWHAFKEHRAFIRLVERQDVRDLVEARKKSIETPAPGSELTWETVEFTSGDIKKVRFESGLGDSPIKSFDMRNGDWVYETETSLWQVLLVPLSPILGFLVPYGVIRIVAWVMIGFAS